MRLAWVWAAQHGQMRELSSAAYTLWQFYLAQFLAEGEHMFAAVVDRIDSIDNTIHSTDASLGVLSLCLAAQATFLNQQTRYAEAVSCAERAIQTGVLDRGPNGCLGESAGYLRKGQALVRTGRTGEALTQFEHALSLARRYGGELPNKFGLQDVEWDAQLWIGVCAQDRDDQTSARAHALAALDFCRVRQILNGQVRCLTDLCAIAVNLNDMAAAQTYSDEALHLARQLKNVYVEGRMSLARGQVFFAQERYSSTLESLTHALAISKVAGGQFDLTGIEALLGLGLLAVVLGDYTVAGDQLNQALHLARAINMHFDELFANLWLALLKLNLNEPALAMTHAADAEHIAQELDRPTERAWAQMYLAQALEATNRLSEATQAYEAARLHLTTILKRHFAAEPLAGLARVALTQGDLLCALTHVEAILELTLHQPRVGWNGSYSVYLTCWHVLQAAGDGRATSVLQAAHALLVEGADSITDAALRESFLHNVATNREVVQTYAHYLPTLACHILPRTDVSCRNLPHEYLPAQIGPF